MDLPISKIDELLSGMLDGILTDAELRELDKAMLEDASLQGRLDELTKVRRALLAGRPRGHLSVGLAKSITEKARAQAASMGADAPAWLVKEPGAKPAFKPELLDAEGPVNGVTWRPWLYTLALSCAAVLAVVFMNFPSRDADPGIAMNPQPLVPEVPPQPAEKIAAAEKPSDPVLEPDIEPKGAVEIEPNTMVADDSPKSVEPPIAVNPVDPKAEPKNGNLLASQTPASMGLDALLLTLVFDVAVDPIAEENNALDAILEKHGIISTADFVVSDEQLQALKDSRMVAESKGSEQEKTGILFLKGTAQNISDAMMEIAGQYKDFPYYSMDMATDKSAGELIRQLDSIQVAEGKSGIAQRLTINGQSGVNSPFTASARKTGLRRENKPSKILFGDVRSKQMHVLLLIRSAK